MKTPITIQNLTKRFGKITAVDDVSLKINPGDLFFLLGPSGCGKTTLLRMLAGFTEPDAGSILFADKDITTLPANKRNCGMVFQGYALWPHLTVQQNVAFGLDVRKINSQDKKKQTLAALDRVQMLDYANRKPNALSGGQQQRVALARALVIEPTVLLLDEPLSNLDAKLRQQMRLEIRSICKQAGITAVYVTHDQKEALAMADCIAVLNNGRVEQVGSPVNLYHQPQNRFVADFLGETNFIHTKILNIKQNTATIESPYGLLSSTRFPESLQQGDQVTCSIRPEAITFTNNPTQQTNKLHAKRIESEYLGDTTQHQLKVINSQGHTIDAPPLKALELHPDINQDFTKPIDIYFNHHDTVLLKN